MRYKSITNNPLARFEHFPPYGTMFDIFNDDELKLIVDKFKSDNLVSGTLGSKNSVDHEVRISNVKFHYPNEENFWIFERLNKTIEFINEQFYNFDIYGYDSFQFTEYKSEENGFYNWHMDTFLDVAERPFKGMRKLSLSLLLNDDFEGGEFVINSGEEKNLTTVPLKKGSAIVFPSFLIHKVTPVTKGNRYSLVVWATGPKFI